jgi:hypothetical protein
MCVVGRNDVWGGGLAFFVRLVVRVGLVIDNFAVRVC